MATQNSPLSNLVKRLETLMVVDDRRVVAASEPTKKQSTKDEGERAQRGFGMSSKAASPHLLNLVGNLLIQNGQTLLNEGSLLSILELSELLNRMVANLEQLRKTVEEDSKQQKEK